MEASWLALFAGFVVAEVLVVTIVMVNRPRFLVVPYIRDLDRSAIRAGTLP